MRFVLFIVVLLLFAPISVMGQGDSEKMDDDERAFLRRGFKLPDSAPITEIKSKSFSTDRVFKVCLESIIDLQVRMGVSAWIDEWNKKEGDKYGTIEITSDSFTADITMLRYLRPLPPSNPASKLTWRDEEGKVHPLIPSYSYFLIRTVSDNVEGLEILWREVVLTYKEEYKNAVKHLTEQLKKIIKERAKPQKTK